MDLPENHVSAEWVGHIVIAWGLLEREIWRGVEGSAVARAKRCNFLDLPTRIDYQVPFERKLDLWREIYIELLPHEISRINRIHQDIRQQADVRNDLVHNIFSIEYTEPIRIICRRENRKFHKQFGNFVRTGIKASYSGVKNVNPRNRPKIAKNVAYDIDSIKYSYSAIYKLRNKCAEVAGHAMTSTHKNPL